MPVTTVAVDLAKDVFQVAMADRGGHVIDRRRLTRRQFERFLGELPTGTHVIMEACGTAHHWGRQGSVKVLLSRARANYGTSSRLRPRKRGHDERLVESSTHPTGRGSHRCVHEPFGCRATSARSRIAGSRVGLAEGTAAPSVGRGEESRDTVGHNGAGADCWWTRSGGSTDDVVAATGGPNPPGHRHQPLGYLRPI